MEPYPTSAPAYLRVNDACRLFSISRSQIYKKISAGNICAIKAGRTTLIERRSIERWFDSLPRLHKTAA